MFAKFVPIIAKVVLDTHSREIPTASDAHLATRPRPSWRLRTTARCKQVSRMAVIRKPFKTREKKLMHPPAIPGNFDHVDDGLIETRVDFLTQQSEIDRLRQQPSDP